MNSIAGLIVPLAIVAMVIAAIVLLSVILLPTRKSESSKALAQLVADYARDPNDVAPTDQPLLQKIRIGSSERTAKFLEKQGWAEKLRQMLSSAGMRLKPEEFVLVSIGTAFAGLAAMFLLSRTIPACVLGLFLGAAAPVIYLRIKVTRREAAFLAELPDTLMGIASAMSAGSSLPQAIESVAKDSTGPMGDELHRALIQMRLGTPVADALEESAARMHCDNLLLVVMAMRLQSAHGGNLSELLKTVAATLRERVQMKRHVRALSAEGRLSIWVLLVLPVGVLGYMAVVRPEYFNILVATTPGLALLTLAGIMMLVGYIWGNAVTKVEV